MPAAQVGLDGRTVKGWAYTLYDGSIYWDHSGVERNTTLAYVGTYYESNVTTGATMTYYYAGSSGLRCGKETRYTFSTPTTWAARPP